MKKIQYILLAIFTLVSASAWAKPLTVKWSNPGSVRILTGSIAGQPVDLEPGQTELVFAEAPKYIVVFPTDGYALTAGTLNSIAQSYQNLKVSYSSSYGQYITADLYSNIMDTLGDNPTMTIETVKVERDDTFTIEIENGARCISASFIALLGYTPELHNGTNTVKFNPLYDTKLQVSLVFGEGAQTLYKVELNGKAIEKSIYGQRWEVGAIKPGDRLVLRAFEGDEIAATFCDLSVQIPDGALVSLYNRTERKFIDLPADGALSVPEGTELAFNLNTGDFTFTGITYAGTSIFSDFNEAASQLVLTVNKPGALVFEAIEREYADLPMTAYIMNPEGVRLTPGYYNSDLSTDLSGGASVASDIAVAGYVLTADKTRKYSLTVSERAPYFYVHAQPGWYIRVVLAYDEGSFALSNRVEFSFANSNFYIIAEPFTDNAFLDVELLGSGACYFEANRAISGLWDNPTHNYNLKQGSQQIGFIEGYDDPFTARNVGTGVFAVYNDGLAVNPDDDGNYIIPFHAPAPAGTWPKVTINNSGKDVFSGAIKLEGDDNATIAYGRARNEAFSPYTYLQGTPVYITPSFAPATVTLNGKILTPDAKGTFTFDMPVGTAKVTVTEGDSGVAAVSAADATPAQYFNLQGIRVENPAKGGVYIRRQGGTATKIVF